MAILTDGEIKEAIRTGELEIDPFDEEHGLQPARYDMKLGKRAIITKSVSLEELKGKIQKEEVKEVNVEKEESITIPGGAFALVSTLERIRLAGNYAGHIGMRTYYTRTGRVILSGLQIDPKWAGVLGLGLANLSPRVFLPLSLPGQSGRGPGDRCRHGRRCRHGAGIRRCDAVGPATTPGGHRDQSRDAGRARRPSGPTLLMDHTRNELAHSHVR